MPLTQSIHISSRDSQGRYSYMYDRVYRSEFVGNKQDSSSV